MSRLIIASIFLVLAGRGFNANAQTETNLYSFVGAPDGYQPFYGLVQGSDGNFYGTTAFGGSGTNTAVSGRGTVFRISASGSKTNLHSFTGAPSDGDFPHGDLVQGSDGNFYGTTYFGGTNGCNCGTVFRMSPIGSYTKLYSFGNSPSDGKNPAAGLVQGSDSNFYGTTAYGGTINSGTVFRISPSGSYTNLYSFGSVPNDGAVPAAGLVQSSDSSFYGTTEFGGTIGTGTVFRISASGSETNLHSFAGAPNDGAEPAADLVQGSDGNFYGTTQLGGLGGGTVFRISPSGNYTNLYSFGSVTNDGYQPSAGLVQASDGNFYGTTIVGGTHNNGTVFRISPSVTYTSLYSFAGLPNDGSDPLGGLVQGSDGNFYGTTEFGGTNTFPAGTVFRFSVPLNPPPYPINQITGVRLSGTNIIVSIPSIAHETYQLQFSSSMTPTNWSNVPGASVSNSIGALLTLTNFGGALQPQGFYRFDIMP